MLIHVKAKGNRVEIRKRLSQGSITGEMGKLSQEGLSDPKFD